MQALTENKMQRSLSGSPQGITHTELGPGPSQEHPLLSALLPLRQEWRRVTLSAGITYRLAPPHKLASSFWISDCNAYTY